MVDVYNPFSLLNAFKNVDVKDYWFSSGTPTYLIHLLQHTQENLNELTGKYYEDKEFVDYKADVEKPLPMIYQSGYLTIKGYNRDFGTFLLDYPNNEVKSGFVSLVAASYLKPQENLNSWVRSVVLSLRKGEPEQLRKLFTSFLASIPYTMRSKKDFKRDGSADEALAQIEEKGYARPYESDKRRLYKIGVNFSSETGTVEEWKCLNIG